MPPKHRCPENGRRTPVRAEFLHVTDRVDRHVPVVDGHEWTANQPTEFIHGGVEIPEEPESVQARFPASSFFSREEGSEKKVFE